MEISTLLFEKAGAENTDATLKSALQRAIVLGIKQVVVASYHGETIRKAHSMFLDNGIKITGVSVCEGWGSPDGDAIAMSKEVKAEFAGMGITVHTGIQALGGSMCEGLGGAGLTAEGIIAASLRNFCQGMKVAVECVLMVSAAGLIDMKQEVISIAGTGRGADTAIVCKPANPFNFRQLRILEILAKPRCA